MDKCEGFNESGTDNKKATIFEGRRGDASITMEAPTAKDGYEFDKWEESTIEYNGIKMQSFTAIYKEKDTQKEESTIQTLIDSMITTTTTLFKNI